jgi:hypothetical protein
VPEDLGWLTDVLIESGDRNKRKREEKVTAPALGTEFQIEVL